MPTVPNGPVVDERPLGFMSTAFPTTVGPSRVLIRTPQGTLGVPELVEGVVLGMPYQTIDGHPPQVTVGWRGMLGPTEIQVYGTYYPPEYPFMTWQGYAFNTVDPLNVSWFQDEMYPSLPAWEFTLAYFLGPTNKLSIRWLSEWVDVMSMFPLATLADEF